MRHAGHEPEHRENRRGDHQRLGLAEELRQELRAGGFALADARHDETGSRRDHQRGNLRHQAVADGEQHVVVRGLRERQVVLQHADGEPAEDVDEEDQDPGDGVAAHELRRAVHRAVEVGLGCDLQAAPARLVLADQACIEVGVDRHLLAGHRVEGEPRADLGDASGALRDHDEIDDDQDREHDEADREVAADEELAERLDDLPGGVGAGVPVQQHDPRGCDVERQAQQRRQQQHGREHREVERPLRVHRREQHDHRERDVEREQEVEQERRQRQHHHAEDQHDEERPREPDHRRARHPKAQRERVHAGLASPAAPRPRCCGSSSAGTSHWAGSVGAAPPRCCQRCT